MTRISDCMRVSYRKVRCSCGAFPPEASACPASAISPFDRDTVNVRMSGAPIRSRSVVYLATSSPVSGEMRTIVPLIKAALIRLSTNRTAEIGASRAIVERGVSRLPSRTRILAVNGPDAYTVVPAAFAQTSETSGISASARATGTEVPARNRTIWSRAGAGRLTTASRSRVAPA